MDAKHRIQFIGGHFYRWFKAGGWYRLCFCAFKNNQQIYSQQIKLRQENSIFQAELLAIKYSIDWAIREEHPSFTIHSDCKSGLLATSDISTSIPIAQSIINKLQKTSKTIDFNWIKGHTGIYGNGVADSLAKNSIISDSVEQVFYPFPASHIKRLLKLQTLHFWQDDWNYDERGRFTHQLLPKVSEEMLFLHRNLYLFATEHGPFPNYLHKFGKTISRRCTCGQIGTSLHYMTTCTLTAAYHLRINNTISLYSWFKTIMKQPCLPSKITQCVSLIENNQALFHLPPPHLLHLDDDD